VDLGEKGKRMAKKSGENNGCTKGVEKKRRDNVVIELTRFFLPAKRHSLLASGGKGRSTQEKERRTEKKHG